MSAFIGEVIGTAILIILGGGVVGGVVLKKSKAQGSGWSVITCGWGLAVTVAVYAVQDISGAHINPAVTLGLASIGVFPWENVPLYICAQIIGSIIGGTIVYFHYLPHWRETQNAQDKLAVFATIPAIRQTIPNLISEIIGTFILMFGIQAISKSDVSAGLGPVVIGGLVLSIGLSLGGPTGYAINPARDLGPRIVHFIMPIANKGPSDWSYAWIPIVGPIIGGVYGANFYQVVIEGKQASLFAPLTFLILLIFFSAYFFEKKYTVLQDS